MEISEKLRALHTILSASAMQLADNLEISSLVEFFPQLLTFQ